MAKNQRETREELTDHTQWRINALSELAERFGLEDDVMVRLEEDLREDLRYLSDLPEGAEKDAVERILGRNVQTRQITLGRES